MSNERELDKLWDRLDSLEQKVDRLLDFRGWVLGAVAAVSTGVSTVIALIAVYFKSR